MNDYILTAENINKKYGKNTILSDVSMNVKKGEIYGLIGKNGSGKTTLFRIITGLIKEYKGNVFVNASRVSAVINYPALFLDMSAVQNMKLQANLLGMNDDNEIKQILNAVGLSNCGNKAVKKFSLGMTQRLKLGMALLENPEILILDEPANGLDPDGIFELRELLLNLNRSKGITILISSHVLNELEQIITYVGILHGGGIVKELSVNDIRRGGEKLEDIYIQYTRGVSSFV
ncbi:MAG: ATP-binding cassette domain-containing protein [Oscillospiraceae bacterium]|nr:ATP-binding cassette domain-containing protein [Oscillospiraceae bacterium]